MSELTLVTVIATQVYLALGIKVEVTHHDVRLGCLQFTYSQLTFWKLIFKKTRLD